MIRIIVGLVVAILLLIQAIKTTELVIRLRAEVSDLQAALVDCQSTCGEGR